MKRTTIMLPDDVLASLRQEARRRGISVAEIVREAVQRHLQRSDKPRTLETYADLHPGIVDASVVAACERLGQLNLATLDRRHFSVVRPRHCAALNLLPG